VTAAYPVTARADAAARRQTVHIGEVLPAEGRPGRRQSTDEEGNG
jgi:hypothetical protein